jgi:hypothetical protein
MVALKCNTTADNHALIELKILVVQCSRTLNTWVDGVGRT